MRMLVPRRERLALGDAPPWWRRSPSRLGRWLLAVGLGLLAAGMVADVTGEASRAIDGLGTSRSVLVARRDLEPGDELTPADVVERQLPAAAVPETAVDRAGVGRVVSARIVEGEVVSARRLAPNGARGVGALVPQGRRAVAVPTSGTGMHLEIGDRVDVVPTDGDGGPSAFPSSTSASSTPGGAVTSGATVVAVDDGAVTLAVDESDVPELAAALGRGTPVLALIGAG